jgi:hypothetical protein
MTVYGAGLLKPKRYRSTNAELEQLDDQIRLTLAEYRPQSVRHVYYVMLSPRLPVSVPKTDSGYDKIVRQTGKMRKAGTLPYSWIADTSRSGYITFSYANVADYVEDMAGAYRAQLWTSLPVLPEVWCESRSIAAVLLPICKRYGVNLYPAGGFSSLTYIYEAAMSLNRVAAGRTVRILYVGDYDPAGVLIDRDIEAKMRTHLEGVELDFVRVGITAEQVQQYDLPSRPRKATERRMKHILETVEAEAMPAKILTDLLAREFEALLPEGYLDAVKAAEESEKEYLESLAEAIRQDRRGSL